MNIYVDGVLKPPADAGLLDGIPAGLQPATAAEDGHVVTYVHASGDLELKPGGGGGFANPMTSVGDMIVGGVAGAPARLAAGSAGYILRVVSGQPTWRELFVPGTLRPAAASAREGQWYWSTNAAAGLELAVCTHQGGTTYAWVTVPYSVTAAGVAIVQAADVPAQRTALGLGGAAPDLDALSLQLIAQHASGCSRCNSSRRRISARSASLTGRGR